MWSAGSVSWRIWPKCSERGSDMSIITWVAISGPSSISSSVRYHQVASRNCESSLSGRKRSGCAQQAALGPDLPQPLGVALVAGALGLQLELDQVARHHLEQAEVQERDAAVAEQQEVAGVRVAGELAVAVHAAEVEAEDDLGHAVAGGLVGLLDGVEAGAVDVLADEHLLAREAR